MLSFEDAETRVLAQAHLLESELVSIDEAVGRALDQDLMAKKTLPPWNNSMMDGYALRACDCPGALVVVEKIFAGRQPRVPITEGTCARIMTGAPMPAGSDAVVMQEKTRVRDDGRVEMLEAAAVGANIRKRGEDVQQGQMLLGRRSVIGLPEAGLLWAQGMTTASVFRKPSVAIASTGDELVPVGSANEGLVDTNSPMLAHGARRAGALVTALGLSADRLEAVVALFEKGLTHDVLLTTSGASVGERDFTQEALKALGVKLEFWKVAMKPGKPLLLGRKGKTLVFGLPGNPVSALVSFELFVRPALRAMQGLPHHAVAVEAKLDGTVSKAPGVRLFARATLTTGEDGGLWARPLASQSSGALASAAGATHLISIPAERPSLGRGEKVSCIPVGWGGA